MSLQPDEQGDTLPEAVTRLEKTYVGTKIIRAAPAEKDGKAGYTVIYPGTPDNPGNYESWSPKQVFETCYREVMPGEKLLF